MSERERIAMAVGGLYRQFDRPLEKDVARATVDALMSYGADAVVAACGTAAIEGGWTRDKTLLAFIAGFLPKARPVYPDAVPTMTDDALRSLIVEVKELARARYEKDQRQRWVRLGRICDTSLEGL